MLVIAVVLLAALDELLGVPDELADDELLELLQPDITADAITTPATQPGSTSVRLI